MTHLDRMIVEGEVESSGQRAIEQLLRSGSLQSAHYIDSTASTNSVALQELKDQTVSANHVPRLVIADHQTAGRGRHGKTWISSNQNLTFSLICRGPSDQQQANWLPLAVGIGLSETIERRFPFIKTELKWPNDVYVNGGKVAGILVETIPATADCVVIGIGVNVGHSPNIDRVNGAAAVGDLSTAVGSAVRRYDILPELIDQVLSRIGIVGCDNGCLVELFQERCALTGATIQFQLSGQTHQGICRGINRQAELVVVSDSDTIRLRSGEVSLVRPTVE